MVAATIVAMIVASAPPARPAAIAYAPKPKTVIDSGQAVASVHEIVEVRHPQRREPCNQQMRPRARARQATTTTRRRRSAPRDAAIPRCPGGHPTATRRSAAGAAQATAAVAAKRCQPACLSKWRCPPPRGTGSLCNERVLGRSTGRCPDRRRMLSASQDTKVAAQNDSARVIEICPLWGSEVGKDAPASRCLDPFFARSDNCSLQARPRPNYTHRDALAGTCNSFEKGGSLLQ